jgi:benzoyl-CoA-dihydrodiol lyase
MAEVGKVGRVEFDTAPDRYRHWKLSIDGRVATLAMDVAEDGGLAPGYTLKLNSYDLGVDIELADAVERLRFEHPEVGAVVITSAKPRVFCAGANIQMLGLSSHADKVNFCKFTNETRLAIEDASENSRQAYICAINGACAGGGYELALAADRIMLCDDGSSTVSLPELPLLAVLPGTGGLTRLVDKRKVRRDHADHFCTLTEGMRGERALEWRLVDELVPRSRFDEAVKERAQALAARSDRPADAKGIVLGPVGNDVVAIERDHRSGVARIAVKAPEDLPIDLAGIRAAGAEFWPLKLARQLDHAVLDLRINEPELGCWVIRTEGDAAKVLEADALLERHAGDWLVREITLYLKRVLKRIDLSARSVFALVEPGACFAGTLAELAFAADRSYMLEGSFEGSNETASLTLSAMNFGPYPMSNGLTRLASRFLAEPSRVDALKAKIGQALDAEQALEAGLVTFTPDDIDWEDEVRIAIEERASFSPDALTGMEASLRFAGPETLETKIFARLSAWQNWIFQRPNAVGPEGALKLYGTGKKAQFDRKRT